MRNILLLAVITLLNICFVKAQNNSVLVVNGYVETIDGNPLVGTVAELYENETKVKSSNTSSEGMFSFTLDYGKNYKIIVSRPGMIHKRIDFNTNIPAESQRKLIKEFAVTLVENCEGANTSVFDEPADKVEFDKNMGNFVSNRGYFEKMQNQFTSAYADIERCKQKKYDDNRQSGDQAMKSGKYEEAKKSYEKALEASPNDSYLKRQIGQANKGIVDQGQADTKYNQLIKEADQYLAQNQLAAAKQRYSEAAKLKTTEAYPQQKMKDIDAALAQQADKARQDQSANNQYNDIINKANAAMASKNYPMAQQLFEQASKMRPNDPFPAQKIAEAQQAIQKQEQQKAEQANTEKAYQDIMAQAQAAMQKSDYPAAQELFQKALTYKPNEALPRQSLNEAQKLDAQKKQQNLKTQQQEVERKYNEAIQKANGLLAQKEYQHAINAYKEALTVKPSDSYTQKQITKAQNLLVEEQQKQQVAAEQAYDQAIALGDSKKLGKDYQSAITAYQQALQSKPNDATAQGKLAEAQKLLMAQQTQLKADTEQKAKFNQLVQEGDGLFKAQKMDEARLKYQQASAIYPTEAYPKNQIAAIDNLAAKNQKEAEYTKIVAQADLFLTQNKYDDAKAQYSLALKQSPEKLYPQQKINEINKLLADKVKQDALNQYNQVAAQAEQQITLKNFDKAKNLYAQAQTIMPDNPYPKQRINEINSMITAEAKNHQEQQYNQLIADADKLLGQQQFDQARAKYTQAQQMDPSKPYPGQKLNEINSLIASQAKKAVEDKYNALAAQAEQQILQKNFELAKNTYSQAALVMPENQYPKKRINEINSMITEQARNAQEADYNKLITQADGLLNQKQFDQAKNIYAQAQKLMPEKTYPQQKINEINQTVSDVAKQKVQDQYDNLIKTADQQLAQKNYNAAVASYQSAQKVFPEQAYPQQKINEINSLLADIAKQEKDKLDKKAGYDKTLALADKYFNDKNYILARSEYNNALKIFPDESYPKNQINAIEQQLSLIQQDEAKKHDLEQKYNAAIVQADELFKNKKYADAKTYYQQAKELKPSEVHSAEQLKRIDDIFAQQASDLKKQTDLEKQYADLISQGDAKFGTSSFKDAKNLYLAAQQIKPNEAYPREQIKKADEKIKAMTTSQASIVTSANKTSSNAETKLAELNFKTESERAKYLADLKSKYPEGVSMELFREGKKTTKRYVVIRSGEVHEYRDISYTWGGQQYTVDGKPTNSFYVQSQVKPREGEKYSEVEK
jgi:tetratricopeptide (TPR) repeat protein